MKMIKPPTKPTRLGPLVFLAGSIEQGAAKPWHDEVYKAVLKYDGCLMNPRRDDWDASLVQDITNKTFFEQVTWEQDGIERADIVFVYFQGDTKSPITIGEFYQVITRGTRPQEIIVVCENDFWRLGNIQVMCDRACVPLYSELSKGILVLQQLLSEMQ